MAAVYFDEFRETHRRHRKLPAFEPLDQQLDLPEGHAFAEVGDHHVPLPHLLGQLQKP